MRIHNVTVDKSNSNKYKKIVLDWLDNDYKKKGRPDGHFWYNKSTIAEAFDERKAMVAVNDKDKMIGYMIWTKHEDDAVATIDIVEVREECQRKGVFKKMLEEFEQVCDVPVIVVSPILGAERVYENAGWTRRVGLNHECEFYKVVKPGAPQLTTLPEGAALALFSKEDREPGDKSHIDYYVVASSLDEFAPKMRYFRLEFDENGMLRQPIVTEFHYEGYVGVYLNGELLAQGKAKHLFENSACDARVQLFCADRFVPSVEEKFPESFFPEVKPRPQPSEQTSAHNYYEIDVTESALTRKRGRSQHSDSSFFNSRLPVEKEEADFLRFCRREIRELKRARTERARDQENHDSSTDLEFGL